MERLTEPDGDYCRDECGQVNTCKRLKAGNPCYNAKCYDRLRRYENTGFPPEALEQRGGELGGGL